MDLFVSYCVNVVPIAHGQDVTADEFVLVMSILAQCKLADTVSGQQQLVELVADQCNLSQAFSAADQENIDRIVMCIKHGLPYFSVNFRVFFCHISAIAILIIGLNPCSRKSSRRRSCPTSATRFCRNGWPSAPSKESTRNWTFSNCSPS